MSKASNGGAIGKLRIPNFNSAPGVWDINTQTLYKGNNNWPSPSVPGFTNAYQTLIDDYVGMRKGMSIYQESVN